MKLRLPLLAALLALAAPAALAGTVTAVVTTTTKQDNALAGFVAAKNATTCATKSLPATCTDAEFVAAGGAAGSVFANADAAMSALMKSYIKQITQEERQRVRASLGVFIDDDATAAQKNAICAAWGKPNGCLY